MNLIIYYGFFINGIYFILALFLLNGIFKYNFIKFFLEFNTYLLHFNYDYNFNFYNFLIFLIITIPFWGYLVIKSSILIFNLLIQKYLNAFYKNNIYVDFKFKNNIFQFRDDKNEIFFNFIFFNSFINYKSLINTGLLDINEYNNLNYGYKKNYIEILDQVKIIFKIINLNISIIIAFLVLFLYNIIDFRNFNYFFYIFLIFPLIIILIKLFLNKFKDREFMHKIKTFFEILKLIFAFIFVIFIDEDNPNFSLLKFTLILFLNVQYFMLNDYINKKFNLICKNLEIFHKKKKYDSYKLKKKSE